MLHPLESKLAEAWPPAQWADVTVLVALSGGADSVALLRAMAALKRGGAGRLCAAHLNHQLRTDAEEDEQFVVELCGRLGVTCEVGRVAVDRLAAESSVGIESAARTARYRFLEQAAGRLGARFVVTAHTADDQAETVLHRILRGTGIRGLAGMARARPLGHATLIRPLLGVRRAELRVYLDDLAQPHRRDSSNLDLRFTRNRIRRRLLPRLQRQFNPDAVEALLRLGNLAGEVQAVIDGLVDEWFDRCVTVEAPDAVRIDLRRADIPVCQNQRRTDIPVCQNERRTDIPVCQMGANIPVCPIADSHAGRQECLPSLGAQECLPSYLLRELLAAVWRRMGWPQQSMGAAKWDELAALAASPSAKHVFPGGVVVETAEGEMRLNRPIT
jgi:tRNA(Ile)-lysidine synthase